MDSPKTLQSGKMPKDGGGLFRGLAWRGGDICQFIEPQGLQRKPKEKNSAERRKKGLAFGNGLGGQIFFPLGIAKDHGDGLSAPMRVALHCFLKKGQGP